jgi:hypothetical protein
MYGRTTDGKKGKNILTHLVGCIKLAHLKEIYSISEFFFAM